MKNRFESEKVGRAGTKPEVGRVPPDIPLFTLNPGWSRFFDSG